MRIGSGRTSGFLLPPDAGRVDIFEDGDCYAFLDRFGSKLNMPKDGGLYYDWVDPFPIPEPTDEALAAYRWPRCDPPEGIAEMRESARNLWENTDLGVAAGLDIVRGILEEPTHLMGFEKFYETLLTNEAFADRLMSRLTDLYADCCERFLDEVGPTSRRTCSWTTSRGRTDGWSTPTSTDAS